MLENRYEPLRYGSRRVEWLRQAVRQILFVFIPVAMVAIYSWQFHVTPYQRMYQEDLIISAVMLGIPIGLTLWFCYRIVRFAIGR